PTYGKTTVQELLSLKGESIKEVFIRVYDSKVLHFENNEKYQVKDDIVINGYLNTVHEQKSINYWKHAFKDCDVVIQKITEKVNGHEPPEYLMKCDAMGVGVVYVQDSDIVLRVVEYEAK